MKNIPDHPLAKKTSWKFFTKYLNHPNHKPSYKPNRRYRNGYTAFSRDPNIMRLSSVAPPTKKIKAFGNILLPLIFPISPVLFFYLAILNKEYSRGMAFLFIDGWIPADESMPFWLLLLIPPYFFFIVFRYIIIGAWYATTDEDDIILDARQKVVWFGDKPIGDFYRNTFNLYNLYLGRTNIHETPLYNDATIQFGNVGAIQVLENNNVIAPLSHHPTIYEANLVSHTGARIHIISTTHKDLFIRLVNDYVIHIKAPLWNMSSLVFTSSEAQSDTSPPVGTISKGYRFKGGEVNNKDSWEKI